MCASLLKKNLTLNVFLNKINSFFVELNVCAQVTEEEYKCDSNAACF